MRGVDPSLNEKYRKVSVLDKFHKGGYQKDSNKSRTHDRSVNQRGRNEEGAAAVGGALLNRRESVRDKIEIRGDDRRFSEKPAMRNLIEEFDKYSNLNNVSFFVFQLIDTVLILFFDFLTNLN